jgi:hypothetical protein
MVQNSKSVKVLESMQPRFQEIVSLTDAPLCQEKLNSEYAELCRELAAALARKRPSPGLGDINQRVHYRCALGTSPNSGRSL